MQGNNSITKYLAPLIISRYELRCQVYDGGKRCCSLFCSLFNTNLCIANRISAYSIVSLEFIYSLKQWTGIYRIVRDKYVCDGAQGTFSLYILFIN